MNALILLAAAAVGVDFGSQMLEDGGLEVIIQIEPESLDALRSNDGITGYIPDYLRDVRSYRIRIGNDVLPQEGQSYETESSVYDQGASAGDDEAYEPEASEESLDESPSYDETAEDDPGPLPDERPATELKDRRYGRYESPLSDKPLLTAPAIERADKPTPAEEPTLAEKPTLARPPLTTRRDTPAPEPFVVEEESRPLNKHAAYREPAEERSSVFRPKKAAAKPEAKRTAVVEKKPWLPLTFTLLCLFASLGANCYLGLIGWGFRERYLRLLADRRKSKAPTYDVDTDDDTDSEDDDLS